jgi:hypothetical protein
MVGVKKTISTVIVAVAVASVVHADMMPVSSQEGDARQSLSICDQTVPPPRSSFRFAICLETIALDSLPVGTLPSARGDGGGTDETKPLVVLTDRQNSFSLCLYALMGLGLCRTAPWVKRLHIGVVPDWYHAGGPYQIGRSFATSPDCLTPAPALCFVQPQQDTQDVTRQYVRELLARPLGRPQFTPAGLASRGPPLWVNEFFFA